MATKQRYDLVEIVTDTERTLAARPSQYFTPFDALTRKDEKLLSEFLTQDRNERLYFSKYSGWEILINPDQYSRPKRYVNKAKQALPRLTAQVCGLDANVEAALAAEIGLTAFAVVKTLPNVLCRVMDIQRGRYESIVAHAKQIADERKAEPVDVVKDVSGRDEIYRRIFRTKAEFEKFDFVYAQTARIILAVAYKLVELTEQQAKQARNIPIIGWLAAWQVKRAAKQLPPREVAESFITDELVHSAKVAERIYGRFLGQVQVIDV